MGAAIFKLSRAGQRKYFPVLQIEPFPLSRSDRSAGPFGLINPFPSPDAVSFRIHKVASVDMALVGCCRV
jgi:hypothetical protein